MRAARQTTSSRSQSRPATSEKNSQGTRGSGAINALFVFFVAQVISIAIFGTLASTVFSDFHVDALGQQIDTYQALILFAELLCILAGAIVFTSLHGARVTSTTNPAVRVAHHWIR